MLVATLVGLTGPAVSAADPPAKPQAAPPAKQPAAPVAVLSFDVAGGADAGAQWADLLTVRMADHTPVVDRTRMREIVAELQLTAGGFTAPDAAVQIGKLTGAKTLLAAGMYEIGERRVVALRAVEVETGRAVGKTLSLPIAESQLAAIDRIAEVVLESLPAWQTSEPAEEAAPRPQVDLLVPAVAVLNFEPAGAVDDQWSWLSTGLGDLTINLLASQNTRVISRDAMQAMLRELAITQAQGKFKQSPGDLKPTLKFIKAQRAVHGVYQVSGDRVQLRMSLLEASSGKPVHTATVEGPSGDLLALHRKATAEILDVLEGRKVGTLDPKRLPVWNDDVDASRSLYQGVALFDQGRYLDAWLLFRRTQKVAPHYPDAAYWAGRMMYYSLEYHQARHDLLEFLTRYGDHPRAADAGLEIIHCTQSVGASQAEVLETLALVGAMAPLAEVANFERLGEPTYLGYYTDALASQLHVGKRNLRAAAEVLGRHLEMVPREHKLYSHAWSRMFELRLRHLNTQGEWFELPPPPIYTKGSNLLRSAGGRHPLEEFRSEVSLTEQNYGLDLTADIRSERKFVHLTVEQPTQSFDLSDDPLVLGGTIGERYPRQPLAMATFLHYVVAPRGHYLSTVTVDMYAEDVDPKREIMTVHNDRERTRTGEQSIGRYVINRPDHSRFVMTAPAGARVFGVAPQLRALPPYPKPIVARGRVVRWQVTADFTPIGRDVGTLIVHQPADSPLTLMLPRPNLPIELAGFYSPFPAGDHPVRLEARTNTFRPGIIGRPTPRDEVLSVPPGATTEATLVAAGSPVHHPDNVRWEFDVSTDLHTFTEIHRTGIGRAGDQRTWDHVEPSLLETRDGNLVAVWSVQRDIYLSTSRDHGRTWTPCRQLSVPVNSAHTEQNPCLLQDREGRYVLAFGSDRAADHRDSLYVCWSDDLVEFSAPVRATLVGDRPHRIWQRADGTYLLYARTIGRWREWNTGKVTWDDDEWGVIESADLLHWSAPTPLGVRHTVMDVIPDGDGFLALEFEAGKEYEFTAKPPRQVPETLRQQNYAHVLTSADGVRFARGERFTLQEVPQPTSVDDPRCFLVPRLTMQRVGDRLYLFAGGREGKIYRRDGSRAWTEVLHMPSKLGFERDQAFWLFGADGYVRLTEGPLKWLPTRSAGSAAGVEYAAVPQLSATRFNVNLDKPAISDLEMTGKPAQYRGPLQGRLDVVPFLPPDK